MSEGREGGKGKENEFLLRTHSMPGTNQDTFPCISRPVLSKSTCSTNSCILQVRKRPPLSNSGTQLVGERFRCNTQCPALAPRVHSFNPHIQPATTFPSSAVRLHVQEQRDEHSRQASAVLERQLAECCGKMSQGIHCASRER